MPGGNRTGPAGRGPQTGRGLGYCSGYNSPGFNKAPGMGMGFGRGGGRGVGPGRGLAWRRGRGGGRGYNAALYPPYAGIAPVYNPPTSWNPNISPENQVNMLKQEKEFLESEVSAISNALEEINKKISDLEKTE